MTFWPGYPIFHSRDLVHWVPLGAAVADARAMPIARLDTWQGLYAPDLKWHNGRFYLTGTCTGCGGNFVMTAPHTMGSRAPLHWSAPHWLPFEGIDPSLFFDSDGRAYFVHNGAPPGPSRWDGHRAIWLQEFDPATLALIGAQSVLVDGGADPADKPFWIEGPHLIRHDGRYMLFTALGGDQGTS